MTEEKIQYVALDLIDLDGNIRSDIDEQEIENRMQSMRSVGLLQPVRLRPRGQRFTPTDGFCRVICAKRLGWKSIASIVENEHCTDVDVQMTALIANCQRTSLSDLDTAEVVEDLMRKSGWNASETATRLGFSNVRVSRLRKLNELPQPIREAIRAGKIPASSGVELSGIEDSVVQAALADRIKIGELTRDGLAGEVKRRRTEKPEKRASGTARITAELGNGRTITLAGGELNSLDTLIGWLEELLAKARKARPKGLEVGTFVRMLRDEAKAV